ncbi:hypothetical protein K402DRAFT_395393 [Aulographum hederae CBS 113979]|uniref:Uncharacterized protein n=1 Tax=Aulographum hederae CBS 113979 TaxID=1176131 RepID=A0A6G1GUT6_9PEZI|nr:hypothetical protein K402DRAFT_395393 [Aulographum hederae CBS 113979]
MSSAGLESPSPHSSARPKSPFHHPAQVPHPAANPKSPAQVFLRRARFPKSPFHQPAQVPHPVANPKFPFPPPGPNPPSCCQPRPGKIFLPLPPTPKTTDRCHLRWLSPCFREGL